MLIIIGTVETQTFIRASMIPFNFYAHAFFSSDGRLGGFTTAASFVGSITIEIIVLMDIIVVWLKSAARLDWHTVESWFS